MSKHACALSKYGESWNPRHPNRMSGEQNRLDVDALAYVNYLGP